MKKLLLILTLATAATAQDSVKVSPDAYAVVIVSTNVVSLRNLRLQEYRLTNEIAKANAELAKVNAQIATAKKMGLKEPTNSIAGRRAP